MPLKGSSGKDLKSKKKLKEISSSESSDDFIEAIKTSKKRSLSTETENNPPKKKLKTSPEIKKRESKFVWQSPVKNKNLHINPKFSKKKKTISSSFLSSEWPKTVDSDSEEISDSGDEEESEREEAAVSPIFLKDSEPDSNDQKSIGNKFLISESEDDDEESQLVGSQKLFKDTVSESDDLFSDVEPSYTDQRDVKVEKTNELRVSTSSESEEEIEKVTSPKDSPKLSSKLLDSIIESDSNIESSPHILDKLMNDRNRFSPPKSDTTDNTKTKNVQNSVNNISSNNNNNSLKTKKFADKDDPIEISTSSQEDDEPPNLELFENQETKNFSIFDISPSKKRNQNENKEFGNNNSNNNNVTNNNSNDIAIDKANIIEDIDSSSSGDQFKSLKSNIKQEISIEDDIEESPEKRSQDFYVPLILSEHKKVQVPASINGILKDYQREGVKFLYGLFKKNKGGILGDEMGLGKTVQTIAFISGVLGTGDKSVSPFFGKKRKKKKKPVLVVAPASVLTQWDRECKKFARFSLFIYHGKNRQQALKAASTRTCDILLTSYDTFRLNFDSLNDLKWSCIVFDEIHKIKNKGTKITEICKKIKTKKRYGLTGTVMQNNLEELFTLIDFVRPGYLGTLDEFRAIYSNPIKTGQRHNAYYFEVAVGRIRSKRLSRKLKKVVLRRDKSLIADSLPGKDDKVIFCQLAPVQAEVYKKVLESPLYNILRQFGAPCDCGSDKPKLQCCSKDTLVGDINLRAEVFPAISRLQKISNHLGLLTPIPSKDQAKFQRDIDFEKMAFGEKFEQIKQTLYSDDDLYCGKLRVLRQLFKDWHSAGDKVLLFSYSTKTLDILEKFVIKERYQFCRIDGTTQLSARQNQVDRFNRNKSVFVCLISTKAGGLGLNLVAANRVVVFDPNWNVALDLQAQDRAYRIGQTRHTEVFRMISAGTIEEITYSRQIYKQQLASVSLDGNSERRYFKGGTKGENGEIFGMANLFKLDPQKNAILAKAIIARTENKENQFDIQSDGLQNETGNNKILENLFSDGNDNLDDLGLDQNQIDQIEKGGSYIPTKTNLANYGVVYSHLNTDILGASKMESHISEKASAEAELLEKNQLMAINNISPSLNSQSGTFSNFNSIPSLNSNLMSVPVPKLSPYVLKFQELNNPQNINQAQYFGNYGAPSAQVDDLASKLPFSSKNLAPNLPAVSSIFSLNQNKSSSSVLSDAISSLDKGQKLEIDLTKDN